MNLEMIVVRGGGDLATGIIHRLWSAGFSVIVLECDRPTSIRRQVSISEAVYNGTAEIEGMTGVLVSSEAEIRKVLEEKKVPVLVDPEGFFIERFKPWAVIDAIIAKKNLGTTRNMAELTIGVGPGFLAGTDTDVVIETCRGHNLGRVIRSGSAVENTGIPGTIAGYNKERVIHAPASGKIRNIHKIGDLVKQGDSIAWIETAQEEVPVPATIDGLLRGLIRDGYPVTEGLKIADIDPRKEEKKNCFTISDKARCIAGSVLEVICAGYRRRG